MPLNDKINTIDRCGSRANCLRDPHGVRLYRLSCSLDP